MSDLIKIIKHLRFQSDRARERGAEAKASALLDIVAFLNSEIAAEVQAEKLRDLRDLRFNNYE